MEERIDKLLLQLNLVSSRVRAEEIIRKYGVKVDGKLITKTGKKVPTDATIELLSEEIPWVSRGALKLVEAVEKWTFPIVDKTFMDIGASTGGFTEVLLKNGAKKVFCVDVGKDQLHASLKEDKRIVNLEKTHVRELTNKQIPDICDGCVIDVSFISLEKIIPFITSYLAKDATIVALVKPQFEVGKENIGKGGIVKDQTLYATVLEKIKQTANLSQLEYIDHIDSPILGGDGNKEFLMLLKKIN
ncbi:MAG: TlyA family RNA methyltransferase [Crocinitomicaceae bacterium]|nr:TlyA family RNA methyltransferase [Crocinitomicaceae bacterium]